MDTLEFINEIGSAAVLDMINVPTGLWVLPSITIAQAACESEWGSHAPGFNLFGIKANGSTRSANHVTQEFENGTWITIVAGFRVYDSWYASIQDHALFLMENERYHALLGNRDYVAVANILHTAGYATDPNYATTLIGIVQHYGLTKFDEMGFATMDKLDALDKRLTAVESALAKIPPPDWFITEFGAHALDGIVTDLTGTEDFWRDVTVNLRLKQLASTSATK